VTCNNFKQCNISYFLHLHFACVAFDNFSINDDDDDDTVSRNQNCKQWSKS